MHWSFLFFFFLGSLLTAAPQALYLTLPDNPSTEMSVHWIEKNQKENFSSLFYQKKGETHWKKISFNSEVYLGASYFIKRCLISHLDPETTYTFRLEGDDISYQFSTLPEKLKAPLRFALGGDLMESLSLFRRMNQIVAGKNPDFMILGGDIAYAAGAGLTRGKHGSVSKWVSFFKEWQKTMVTQEGRMIPMIAAIGNHDVTSTDRKEKGKNALFFKFFPSNENRSYKTLEIADVLSLFLLDSGHLFPIDSKQTQWLERTFQENNSSIWKVPVYHIGAYPSTYTKNQNVPNLIKKNWLPLFEKFGVKVAFENHNHAFKRTYPLLDDKIDPKGIVYLGDGGYGAPPRKIQFKKYLEQSRALSSFSFVTVDSRVLKVESFNIKNEVIDTWQIKGE